jgi:hypothetical protein
MAYTDFWVRCRSLLNSTSKREKRFSILMILVQAASAKASGLNFVTDALNSEKWVLTSEGTFQKKAKAS